MVPNKKKLIASFSKLEKCKGCDKDLDKNSSDEILRLGLCPTCYSEYIDMKRYVDKYVDEFEIDKAFDTSVDGLLNDYITEKNFEKIFFSYFFTSPCSRRSCLRRRSWCAEPYRECSWKRTFSGELSCRPRRLRQDRCPYR